MEKPFKFRFYGNHNPEKLVEYEFATKVELDAFVLGFDEGLNWDTYEALPAEEEEE